MSCASGALSGLRSESSNLRGSSIACHVASSTPRSLGVPSALRRHRAHARARAAGQLSKRTHDQGEADRGERVAATTVPLALERAPGGYASVNAEDCVVRRVGAGVLVVERFRRQRRSTRRDERARRPRDCARRQREQEREPHGRR